jgi:glutathione peroxidase-family protein
LTSLARICRYGDALEILLYPSDEFGRQELPSEQIPAFVTKKGLPTDGGGCTLMAKVHVNGESSDPLWTFAKEAFPGDVSWNFAAIFVFDKNGVAVGRFSARELPAIEEALRKAMEA